MNKYLDAMAKPFMPITPWLLRLGLGIAFIIAIDIKFIFMSYV